MPLICKKCDGEIDATTVAKGKWGDGEQKTRFAPFICCWCASIFLFDTSDNTLLDPDEAKRVTGIDVIELMRGNGPMWAAIESARKMILATPNRRPVLR